MPISRYLLLIFGICLILGLMIWLVSSLSALYTQVIWSANPILANLLLLLLIILLGLAIFAFFYYTRFFQKSGKSRKKRRPLKIPLDKIEAAEASIKSVQEQVTQIQDEIAKKALLSRSQDMASELAKGNIQVVVFGTGSAGKTSLVNALMGRMVGKVNAPMGTTEVGETYHLKLDGIEREILITDTPGILEAGIAGSERGKLARSVAMDANLLLFVLDNDLRQSEYQSLQVLVEIGKRSLIILNKKDLYTVADQNIILAKLKDRVKLFLDANDVISIAANPQLIKLETGEIIQPESDIMPLIRRIALILRSEGEELIADNILLQSQRLGEEARLLIDSQRKREAEKIVERFQWIGAGVIAVTPLPVIDLIATAAVNTQMVIEIGKIYGCELNADRGRELALSLAKTLGSLGVVKGVIQLVSTALQLNLATLVVGRAIQAVSAAYLTRIAGKSFIEYFRQDQDWGDGGMTEVVQRQFQLTRRDEFVKQFVQDAFAKIIEPLNFNSTEFEEEEQPIEADIKPLLKRYLDDWEDENTVDRPDW
ncbi:Small GTP-binding protein domain protein [Planktothrix sp. PCC 11201]|uniref:YcjF family protein n=1 Tax=Planktothrix sp. PCC 11201 TaxID=1729650 RepID=UPI00091D5EFA|nr:GTP-binding protein [Planktothrix sp. PCC 11201]SKB13477.1 Small GTP-binding protein domain protein [Planktothrix sp. PCC 11201]